MTGRTSKTLQDDASYISLDYGHEDEYYVADLVGFDRKCDEVIEQAAYLVHDISQYRRCVQEWDDADEFGSQPAVPGWKKRHLAMNLISVQSLCMQMLHLIGMEDIEAESILKGLTEAEIEIEGGEPT